MKLYLPVLTFSMIVGVIIGGEIMSYRFNKVINKYEENAKINLANYNNIKEAYEELHVYCNMCEKENFICKDKLALCTEIISCQRR